MIYEYRAYQTRPGTLDALNARFRDHTLKLFEKHGIKSIGYWTPNVGDYDGKLIYIVAFEDAGHRDRAWAALASDPAWVKALEESEAAAGGPLEASVINSLLDPTDYSPLQ